MAVTDVVCEGCDGKGGNCAGCGGTGKRRRRGLLVVQIMLTSTPDELRMADGRPLAAAAGCGALVSGQLSDGNGNTIDLPAGRYQVRSYGLCSGLDGGGHHYQLIKSNKGL